MKEVSFVLNIWDDYEKANGRDVEADHLDVGLVWGERAVTLDLSDKTFKDITEFLAPILDAGTSASPKTSFCLPQAGSITGRAYRAMMRAWGDANGLGEGPGYRKQERGGYYYTKELRDRYTEYLLKQAENATR